MNENWTSISYCTSYCKSEGLFIILGKTIVLVQLYMYILFLKQIFY